MIRLLILMSVLFLPAFALSQEPSPRPLESSKNPKEHSRKTDNSANTYNRGTEKNPIFIKEISSKPSEEVRAAEAKDHDRKASYEWWTVFSTVIIAAFTVVMGVWTVLLWRESKRTAIFTGQTAETMKDTTMQQLRAYVFTKHDEPFTLEINGRLSTATIIKNFGQTPAHDMMTCHRVGIYSLPLTTTNKLEDPIYEPDSPSGPLAPGEVAYQRATIPELLPDDISADIAAGKVALFVFGEIKYVDIFNKPHRTRYCLFSTGEDFMDRSLAYYHQGNEAD
ncbi:MAG: hypothetical protein ACYC7L_01980 [Nitrospirota bacterium]